MIHLALDRRWVSVDQPATARGAVTRQTLHLVPEARWEARDPAGAVLPGARTRRTGFVHCTDGDGNMLDTANRFYRADPQPFLLLTLDLDATGSPWRFDDPGSPTHTSTGRSTPQRARGPAVPARPRRDVHGDRPPLSSREPAAWVAPCSCWLSPHCCCWSVIGHDPQPTERLTPTTIGVVEAVDEFTDGPASHVPSRGWSDDRGQCHRRTVLPGAPRRRVTSC